MNLNEKTPPHIQIAYDIACRIRDHRLEEGAKIRGRTIIATEYQVSSETVRKAFSLLSQAGVIFVKENSGGYVLSREKANAYIELHLKNINRKNYFEEIQLLLLEQQGIHRKIQLALKEVVRNKELSKSILPIETFTYLVESGDYCVGKSAREINLFRHTATTLFGVVKKEIPISSPGSDYIMEVEDLLYFSGDTRNLVKTKLFLKYGNVE